MIDQENPFAGENPFRKLDKKKFQSADKRKQAVSAKPVPKKEEPSFYEAFEAPLEDSDARAFLSAVTGVARLGTPEKASARPKAKESAALSRPLLQPESIRNTSSRAKSAAVPAQPASGKAPSPNGTPQAENVPDEDASFFAAVRDVKPLAGKGREVAAETPPLPQQVQAPGNPLQEFMEGKLEFALAFTDEYVEGHVLGLDLLTVGKLQAGQFSPESHLDLHGMNAQQAFEALVGFFRAAYFKGQRTVLVVPGRGRNSPHGVPILREKVQEWFTQDPFKRVILAFCTARPADGGAGALYVLLRKFRKGQGKVCWERRPADPDLL
ncbi:MAG: Smr/MutS family protein [Bilophila sp.]